MGIRRIGWTLILLFVLSAPLLAATLPASVEEMPIYPGAVRDQDAEREHLDYVYFSDDVIFNEVRAYRVETMIDDVAKFYLEYLEPELGWPEKDVYDLEPGELLGPWYEPDFYGPEIFEVQREYDTLIQDGKWIRTAFEGRPQWQQGKWLAQVWFEWVIKSENGDQIRHSVLVEDEGYDWRARVDFKATRIWFETTVVQGDLMWDGDWDDNDWDDDDWNDDWSWDMEEISLEQPTEDLLGIPFYPGMIFNEELSVGMSMEDFHYYVFFSPDSLDQVASFYEEHLNKEPLFLEGDYLFALRGRLPIPTDGLAIQPNRAFMGFPRTMITVQKQVDD